MMRCWCDDFGVGVGCGYEFFRGVGGKVLNVLSGVFDYVMLLRFWFGVVGGVFLVGRWCRVLWC